MPEILVKDVPCEILEVLKLRASTNHRSLQQELLTILMDAAKPDLPRAVEAADRIREKLAEYGRHYGDSSDMIGDDRER